jgi:hypothetical protein
MALIVENGTGLANAESYISVADATIYHNNHGNAAWAAIATDTIREQLLRKATDYMMAVYRQKWAGYRYDSTQSLDWPRLYVPILDVLSANQFPQYVDFNIVPTLISNACAELALKENSETLMSDVTQATIKEKVDVIEIEYDKYSPQYKRYVQIDNLLSIYFQSKDGTAKLIRS